MSEWDEPGKASRSNKHSFTAGPWDVGMTIAALLAVASAAFLVSYLTKDIATRPVWLLAICFAVPVAALMLAVFLKEKASSSMTPSSSRGAQFALAVGTVFAAALVGCFCQVTNKEAKTETVIQREGWNDLLIILDKSGSMMFNGKNKAATDAVMELLDRMDDNAQVALLIDTDWDTPLTTRTIEFGALSAQRENMKKLANYPCYDTANFPLAFDTAQKMLGTYTADDDEKAPAILVISDGIDNQNLFRSENYAGFLIERGVKVFYLYVDPISDGEMVRLAAATGGQSIDVSNLDGLTDQMQKVVMETTTEIIYKDALRDIEESETAKIVTGILFVVLGFMIGLTLTIMFSLQGQKRFQLFLSPLMALLAYSLLAFGQHIISVPWLREAVAFSMLGLVLMRSNLTNQKKRLTDSQPETDVSDESNW